MTSPAMVWLLKEVSADSLTDTGRTVGVALTHAEAVRWHDEKDVKYLVYRKIFPVPVVTFPDEVKA